MTKTANPLTEPAAAADQDRDHGRGGQPPGLRQTEVKAPVITTPAPNTTVALTPLQIPNSTTNSWFLVVLATIDTNSKLTSATVFVDEDGQDSVYQGGFATCNPQPSGTPPASQIVLLSFNIGTDKTTVAGDTSHPPKKLAMTVTAESSDGLQQATKAIHNFTVS
jgi:hypothetical protein